MSSQACICPFFDWQSPGRGPSADVRRWTGNPAIQPVNRFPIGLALAALSLLVFFSGCSRDTSADAAPPPAQESHDPNFFAVNHPERFPLVTAETRDVADQLDVDGVVAPDISLTVRVTSLSGGKVVDLRAHLGDEVEKGQVLVVIRSQDLAMAISEYQKFSADEILSRKALDRAKLLYDHGAIAQKEVEAAQDAEEKAKVDVTTAAERIRILGGEPDHLSPVIELRAPVPGTIVEQNTTGGEGVKSLDNSPSLFTIADLTRVWVLCDVHEDSLSHVHLGDNVEVRLNAYPDKLFKGQVNNIPGILDPNTRTAKVRVELTNVGRLFRPGMFATARFTARDRKPRMTLPAAALLRLHDKDWVFRKEGGGKYRRVEIVAGTQLTDGSHIVLSGIQPGDQLVANALQFSAATEAK